MVMYVRYDMYVVKCVYSYIYDPFFIYVSNYLYGKESSPIYRNFFLILISIGNTFNFRFDIKKIALIHLSYFQLPSAIS